MQIDRKKLQVAVNALVKTAGIRQILPILTHIRVSPGPTGVALAATDLEVSLEVEFTGDPAGIDTAAAIHAKRLSAQLRALPKSVTQMNLEICLVKPSGTQATLNGIVIPTMSANDFPNLDGKGFTSFGIVGLLDAFKQVAHAVSHEESRYTMNGAYITASPPQVVATDGHRMAIRTLPSIRLPAYPDRAEMEYGPARDALINGIIVPTKCLDILDAVRKLGVAETLAVKPGVAMVRLAHGGQVITRLIDGRFPNYKAVVPTALPNTLVVGKAEFLEAMKVVRQCAHERTQMVNLVLTPENVLLHGASEDKGEATIRVNDAVYTGAPMVMAFCARYLVDAVSVIGDEKVHIGINNPLLPVLISDITTGFSEVIMPMRANNDLKHFRKALASAVPAEPTDITLDVIPGSPEEETRSPIA